MPCRLPILTVRVLLMIKRFLLHNCCVDALGVKARLLPVPQKLVEVCATIIGKRDVAQRLCGNLQVDISKARTLLGWAPPISVADGLKATALG